MASSNFQKRFKDKVGVVLRSGEFSSESIDSDSSPVPSVSKAGTDSRAYKKTKGVASTGLVDSSYNRSPTLIPTKPHPSASASLSSLPKIARNSPLLPAIHEKTHIVRKKSLGKLDNRSNSVLAATGATKGHKSSMSVAETVTKTLEFHPYTLDDYKELRKRSKGKLGGLGPVMVGREDWTKARDLRIKRLNYSQVVGGKKGTMGGT